MKIIDVIGSTRSTLISYEIIPPKRGGSLQQIIDIVEGLMPYDPPFIDVTSHSAQVHYEDMPDGTFRRHIRRKRPGTLGLCATIKSRFSVETVPHLLCSGFTREETEDALIELNYLDLQNVMALRGDDVEFRKPIERSRTTNNYAVDLVRQIVDMNNGRYIEDLIDAAPTNFCIGVAGYPEKHIEAPNMAWDILKLKAKIDAGAHYVTTQMFFDNKKYFNFVDRCREAGIQVPIIPGIKILTGKGQLQSLPRNFYVEIPEALATEATAVKPENVVDVGVEWAVKQCEELMSAGVPCIHFYIMSTSRIVKRVVEPLRKMA